MADAAEHYTAAAGRIVGIVAELDDSELATPVAACPDWTVRDVVCHLTGGAKDITSNNTDGAPGRAWTDAQMFEPRPDPLVE